MDQSKQEGRLYTIDEIAAMTGLNVRTIRNYLSAGQLEGKKADGAWRFTEEQFGAFLAQDMVRQSVQAKANGIVYDFLLAGRRDQGAACVVWDCPVQGGGEEAELRQRVQDEVNARGVRWAYRFEDGMARSILSGDPAALGKVLAKLG